MRARNLALTGAHRLAILAYVIVALFPLFWLLKVSKSSPAGVMKII